MVRTTVSYLLSFFFTALFGIIGTILALFSNSFAIRYPVRYWGKSLLWSCGINLEVEGLENLPKGTSIIMYNHQSSFDIPAFSAALPIEWKVIAKKEVLKMPFIGWVTKVGGHYFVSRDGSTSDTQEVKKIISKIKSGPSVILAPEGTRSLDGKLLPFKKGGFLIALLASVPVVPMVIWGGKNVKPKGSYIIKSGQKIVVKILPSINVSELPKGRKGREELENLVRTAMEEVIEEQINLEQAA